MRKVTFGGASSLDNFFTGPDGSMDWLMWSDEVMEITGDYWSRIDTLIMGRKTYEVALANQAEGSQDAGGIKTYVFSRTLPEGVADGGAEIRSDDPADLVRELKQQDGKEICIMGGGDLARSLLEAGVIDEIGFNIHPVLLGSGTPLFYKMHERISLELLECKTLKNGCVYVLYAIKERQQ